MESAAAAYAAVGVDDEVGMADEDDDRGDGDGGGGGGGHERTIQDVDGMLMSLDRSMMAGEGARERHWSGFGSPEHLGEHAPAAYDDIELLADIMKPFAAAADGAAGGRRRHPHARTPDDDDDEDEDEDDDLYFTIFEERRSNLYFTICEAPSRQFVLYHFRTNVATCLSKMVKYKLPSHVFENGKVQNIRMFCALGLHPVLVFLPVFS